MTIFSKLGVICGKMVHRGMHHYTSCAMQTQQETLLNIMNRNKNCELGKKYGFADIKNLRDFQDKVPLSTFEDYAPLIDSMIDEGKENIITSDKIHRYCSSSGSVGKPKLQPKTAKDILNMYLMGFVGTPGCAALYFEKRGIKKLPPQMGPLLISLNGHPLKNGMPCNGAGQVPFLLLKPFLHHFTTTPDDILFPEDEEGTDMSYFQLRFCLTNKKVTYLGSMVITLLSNMFEYLEENWEMLCDDIETGVMNETIRCPQSLRDKYGKMKPNPARAAELRAIFRDGFDKPVAQRIWPELLWGYGMISSTLAVYMEKLKKYVGNLPMHNMGYAASEGYMAIPVELDASDYVLLPRSIIYEFLPVDAPEGTRPLLLDEIEVGKDYEIIITNFSGLYRYRILDIVHVTGEFNQSKKIEFLYRSNMGLNLANEKTTTQMLDWVAEQLQKKYNINFKGHSFYSDTDSKPPCYAMLVETDSDIPTTRKAEFEADIDQFFRESNGKYDKYRHWGMIGDPVVYQLEKGAYDAYKASLVAQGRVLNQIKPVIVINTPERKEFFFGKVQK